MSNKFLNAQSLVFQKNTPNSIIWEVQVTKKDLNTIFKILDIFEDFGIKERPKDENLLLLNDWNEPWKWIIKKTSKSRWDKNIEEGINSKDEKRSGCLRIKINSKYITSLVKIRGITISRILALIASVFMLTIMFSTKASLPTLAVVLICSILVVNQLLWESRNSKKFTKIKQESKLSRYEYIDYYYNLYSQAISGKLYYPIESLNKAKQLIFLRIGQNERYDNNKNDDIRFIAAIFVFLITILIIYLFASSIPWNKLSSTICSIKGNDLLGKLVIPFCSNEQKYILEWDKLSALSISFLALFVSCLNFLIAFFKALIETMYHFLKFTDSNNSFHSKLKTRLLVIDEVISEISNNDK